MKINFNELPKNIQKLFLEQKYNEKFITEDMVDYVETNFPYNAKRFPEYYVHNMSIILKPQYKNFLLNFEVQKEKRFEI